MRRSGRERLYAHGVAPRPQQLLTPGPTAVPPEVLSALARPVLHHRSPDFADPDVPDGDYSPREGGVHVLASMDETTYDEQDGNETDDDHPIAWCQPYDGGRSWYTGLGHDANIYAAHDSMKMIIEGIRWAGGRGGLQGCQNEGGDG